MNDEAMWELIFDHGHGEVRQVSAAAGYVDGEPIRVVPEARAVEAERALGEALLRERASLRLRPPVPTGEWGGTCPACGASEVDWNEREAKIARAADHGLDVDPVVDGPGWKPEHLRPRPGELELYIDLCRRLQGEEQRLRDALASGREA